MTNAGTGQKETAFTGKDQKQTFWEDKNDSIMIFILSLLDPFHFVTDFLFFLTFSLYHFLFKGMHIMYSIPLKSKQLMDLSVFSSLWAVAFSVFFFFFLPVYQESPTTYSDTMKLVFIVQPNRPEFSEPCRLRSFQKSGKQFIFRYSFKYFLSINPLYLKQ